MHTHDFVIVGAGLAGASTAWHLARAGAKDLILLERETTPGAHASGRNAGIIRERVGQPEWQVLTTEGAAFLRRGELAEFRPTGGLLVGRGDEPVSDRVPPARGAALFCPDDGVLDVAALLHAWLRGRDVRYGCRLDRWERDGEALRLYTSHGEMRTRVLVNAAGAWAGRVGDLPLEPLGRHVFVTAAMPDVDPDWPYVWDLDHGLYFRPESGGLLLSPCDEQVSDPGAYDEDPIQIEILAARVAETQPGLGDLRIAHRWVGQRTFAADRLPVIGFDAREPRLFHVAALGGHGVTSGWAVGARAARSLLEGVDADADAVYAPGRIAPAP